MVQDMAHFDFNHMQTHQVIRCMEEAHVLCVHINQELHWHHHVQLAVQKTENLLMAVNGLSQPCDLLLRSVTQKCRQPILAT